MTPCDDLAVGPCGESDLGAGRAAGPGAGTGVVARPGLFGLLQAQARVTVVSAPAGSGKTVLLRSWIGAAGPADRVELLLTDLDEQDRDRGELRIAVAALRLAQDDPHAAAATLALVLDGSTPVPRWAWLAQAFLLAPSPGRPGNAALMSAAVRR